MTVEREGKGRRAGDIFREPGQESDEPDQHSRETGVREHVGVPFLLATAAGMKKRPNRRRARAHL